MEIQVQHNSERQRFETVLEGRLACVSYTLNGNVAFFDHTFVPAEFRGKGVAAAMVREGLEHARREHWKVVPNCSYVAAFIERHPEFNSLIH